MRGRSESYRRPPDGLKSHRTTQRAHNNGLCTTTARWPVDDAAATAAAVAATTDGIARDRTTARTPPDDDVGHVRRTPGRPIASTSVVSSGKRRQRTTVFLLSWSSCGQGRRFRRFLVRFRVPTTHRKPRQRI